MMEMDPTKDEIDDSLYSRQRYVLGDQAMKKMALSNVLVIGAGGCGVEVAKNVVLTGVKSLTIMDGNATQLLDLGSQFFLREDDVQQGRNRAEACAGHLAELNPYVAVQTRNDLLDETSDLSFLTAYQCVVATECNLKTQLKINEFCRNQSSPIKFIAADTIGVFSYCFCDFGNEFEVFDVSGEEPKEFFVGHIVKGNPGMVKTFDGLRHGLETGDVVTFREVVGMPGLEGKDFQIKVTSPKEFEIGDISGPEFGSYMGGGIARQVKPKKLVSFKSLQEEIKNPTILLADFAKLNTPISIHVGLLALNEFRCKHGRLPRVRDDDDTADFIQLAQSVKTQFGIQVDTVDERVLNILSWTCRGCLPPLCAVIGGFVAQEVLKSVTGKFTPLQQWLFFDAMEVVKEDGVEENDFDQRGDRYDHIRVCVGDKLLRQLQGLKLFMIGCGAIGCEMLKNYALMGIGTADKGKIVMTDNDLIEKSNLNRQFLFRSRHIRQPKSVVAASSTREINPGLRIEPQQHRVCPDTENTVYPDSFYEQMDVVVNALDNVEARIYVDSRCVTNQKPLLESGTMGPKGHIQVIVPFLTESYGSQRDPPEEQTPYCTLKSFPAIIEHCIQWARDKFESSFAQKPGLFNKFWSSETNFHALVSKLKHEEIPDGTPTVAKLLSRWPTSWASCLAQARLKFEKYFCFKARNLLHIFPTDAKLQDGSPFWQLPKRPPKPVHFSPTDKIHLDFVTSCARLYADIYGVAYTKQDLEPAAVAAIVKNAGVPRWRPSNKKVELDESKPKDPHEVSSDVAASGSDMAESVENFFKHRSDGKVKLFPLDFEKDDDSNGHIDFITAAANLRASMYSIEPADRLKTKKIAGHIVPAIATTTAAVSGWVGVELIKLLVKPPIESFRNCFMNLALPVVLFSEPAPCAKFSVREDLHYTIWDRWEVHESREFTIQQFNDHFQAKYNLEVSGIFIGSRMVYLPLIPGHNARLTHPMYEFLKTEAESGYVDLTVSFEAMSDEDDDLAGPPVRYFF